VLREAGGSVRTESFHSAQLRSAREQKSFTILATSFPNPRATHVKSYAECVVGAADWIALTHRNDMFPVACMHGEVNGQQSMDRAHHGW
jgi:hypothetical protein